MFVGNKSIWTDEELMALPNDGRKYELLSGDLLMSPVAVTHSLICVRLTTLLALFVRRRKLGEVMDSSMGFRLAPDIVLSPDVSFVARSRLRKIFVAPDKFLAGAPDLAVEVLSPSDRIRLVERKLDHYFDHGTRLAWVVDWRKKQVHVYTPDSIETLRHGNDNLGGGEVLAGFRVKLNKVFALTV